jgi:hypothetical protein
MDTLIIKHDVFIWNPHWAGHLLLYQAVQRPGKVKTVKRFSPTKASLKALWLNGFEQHFNSGNAFSLECELHVIEKQSEKEQSVNILPLPHPRLVSLWQTALLQQLGRKKAFSFKMAFPSSPFADWIVSWIFWRAAFLIVCRLQSNPACQLWRQHSGAEW